ncbi:glutathione S-transferase family protein [Oscillatoria sp. FACHB-1406]|uniref:glutathione S-transferase family protein n=1 Tax=Oscillatoria sp. FACHB-1406 TaxID=2692846 RepID=UPI001683E84E|nr:glutathione S-transferase family protein [Oscillatoria sp. FACHB-1406]MBD2577857.1 glutathione S-transferase family protein [Oscillatoria sp. FACHB-1406]
MWHLMMSQLAPRDPKGAYIRPESAFRDAIAPDSPHPPQAGRYRLYAGLGCPWAHRTLVTRSLKGLEDAIAVVIVSPSPDEGIWLFEEEEEGCRTLPELYQLAQPGYTGRCTVPVLWDSETKRIVNNESAEIIVILNAAFNEFAKNAELDLYPEDLRGAIDSWNDKIYPSVNNGVYRCGFAQTQAAYEEACNELFAMLDEIDATLAANRYLCGDRVTLADVRLFTTLFRFDIVYHGLFKCNRRRIQDYQHLGAYLRDLYQLPGVAGTCDRDSIKRDYYGNLFPLNPGGIIPLGGDEGDLLDSHNRDKIGANASN